jgi:hypothetical protein
MRTNWIKSAAVVVCTFALLIGGMELAGRYLFMSLMETSDFSVTRHPCFSKFFGENTNRQKKIIRDNNMVFMYPDDGIIRLRDRSSEFENIHQGIRKTCGTGTGPKIYFFGGSTMEGIGNADCDTIPSKFQEANPNVQAINLGVRAANSTIELNYLKNLSLEPGSTLIFLDGVNDNFYEAGEDRLYRKKHHSLWLKFINYLNTNSYFLHWYLLKIKSHATPPTSVSTCSVTNGQITVTKPLKITSDEVFRRYESNVNTTRQYCHDHQLNCRFFIQPMPSYQYNQNMFFADTRGGFSNLQAQYKEFVEKVNHKKIAIDLSGVLNAIPKAYVDKLHYSPIANTAIADAIAKNLFNKNNPDH